MHLNIMVDIFMVLIIVNIMKRLFLIILLIFIYNEGCSQVMDSLTAQSNQEKYDLYFSKHKKQKKTGLILLGSGVVATGAGLLIAANSNVLSDDGAFGSGAVLTLVGSVTTIVSIPYLISSGVNKRKASAYVQIEKQEFIDLTMPNSELLSAGIKFEF